ncbi:unnamed protein product [Pleuronectes platessa]|uniref:Uncharacterized protein n=1 Tax=Pleuronectes platessa TaxID=8262 RepID=A0A9N7UJK3_PLEPL|nr:unnamed protein product [Pleuronectes platessa]
MLHKDTNPESSWRQTGQIISPSDSSAKSRARHRDAERHRPTGERPLRRAAATLHSQRALRQVIYAAQLDILEGISPSIREFRRRSSGFQMGSIVPGPPWQTSAGPCKTQNVTDSPRNSASVPDCQRAPGVIGDKR